MRQIKERAQRILTNCRALTGPRSRLLLLEQAIRPGNGPSLGTLMDLQMPALTPRERTEAEYEALSAAAGFELAAILPTAPPLDIIEAVPS